MSDFIVSLEYLSQVRPNALWECPKVSQMHDIIQVFNRLAGYIDQISFCMCSLAICLSSAF